ncbi:hypothetical protein CGMCC3_g18089 [Colletotrichum fructicola]|nr:uncharacterized protein CGMCC3_g18089 [Colletotrichum fructicola]KAE9565728.1 hypothetical protein CGMCC3_g18089 [Colletotrichum fructicola]
MLKRAAVDVPSPADVANLKRRKACLTGADPARDEYAENAIKHMDDIESETTPDTRCIPVVREERVIICNPHAAFSPPPHPSSGSIPTPAGSKSAGPRSAAALLRTRV